MPRHWCTLTLSSTLRYVGLPVVTMELNLMGVSDELRDGFAGTDKANR
jgi:hypothetical protein